MFGDIKMKTEKETKMIEMMDDIGDCCHHCYQTYADKNREKIESRFTRSSHL